MTFGALIKILDAFVKATSNSNYKLVYIIN